MTTAVLVRRRTRMDSIVPSSSPPVFASWDEWSPADYLRDYYSVVEPDEIETIRFLAEAASGIAGQPPILVFGCGPTLHHVFPLAPYASELHLVDFLPSNLDAIQSWIKGEQGGHDWSAFVRYALECERDENPTDAAVADRQQMVRDKVARLVTADAGHVDPLGADYRAFYPVVVTCYCADSATEDKAVWRRYMRNIGSLAAPGGLVITAALRNATFYTVGDRRFPSANIDDVEMRQSLEADLGLNSVVVETRLLPAHEAQGYSGVILAHGRVPKGATAGAGDDRWA